MSGSHFVLHIFSPLTPAINQTVIFVLKPFTTIQQAIIQDPTIVAYNAKYRNCVVKQLSVVTAQVAILVRKDELNIIIYDVNPYSTTSGFEKSNNFIVRLSDNWQLFELFEQYDTIQSDFSSEQLPNNWPTNCSQNLYQLSKLF